ncbi:MAG TPA: hypothetical protein VKR29_05295 [Candidatus Binataceae bacterium]|jgi:hypothetical protein|nr:hypothetical protein [Candidatus Binataceae bacterium]
MTRVTILLTLLGLGILFVAYAKGVQVIHGGNTLSHMYWATAALTMVALANFIAIAHLARAERMIQQLRALCEKNGIAYGED